jgi:hypothetical protein
MVEWHMTVIMTLRNPVNKDNYLPVYIEPNQTELAYDWQYALRQELINQSELEKNYCWHGWPDTQRDLNYLIDELNFHIDRINFGLNTEYPYIDTIVPGTVMHPFTGIDEDGKRGGGVNHEIMNKIHNHFEHLQGTVNNLSEHYKKAGPETKYSIRQLNNLCHEIETLSLSLRKKFYSPEWIRPSQITTFLNARRHKLHSVHRQGFLSNSYDRKFGYVYMHWAQIGKTLYEVFRDENGADIDKTVCDAITHLEYYSGEFDIEWGRDVVYGNAHPWHTKEMDQFKQWLIRNGFNPEDTDLSLGYLEIGRVDLRRSFGTEDVDAIWKMISDRLDIYKLETLGASATYDYSWADDDYELRQIKYLIPGYQSYV